jgi:hypothetical protein
MGFLAPVAYHPPIEGSHRLREHSSLDPSARPNAAHEGSGSSLRISIPAPDTESAVADVLVTGAPGRVDATRSQQRFDTEPAGPGVLVLSSPDARRVIVVAMRGTVPLQPRPAVMDAALAQYPTLRKLLPDPVEPERYDVALSVGAAGATAARVVTAPLRPGSVDAVIGLFQNVVMLAATAQSGFRRGLLLVDRESDQALSIGLWERGDLMRASEANGYLQRQVEQFAAVLAAPPTHEYYDVVVEAAIPRLGLRQHTH